MDMSHRILEGVRVLDLGRIISAPYCAQLLADMGAEVIKVEKAGKGDDMRTTAEFDYPSMNRNKKSVTIQFRAEEGKELLRKLIEKSDVLIENFRPGTMEKMGFGYGAVKAINPRIIMASISGFGQTGPYSQRAAFDSIIQAVSGIMSVVGTTKTGPVRIGTPILDHLTGTFAFAGVLAALYDRDRTGMGQYIDVSMMDSAVPMLFTHIPNYSAHGIIPGSEEESQHTSVPSKIFQAKDGNIFINAGMPGVFPRFQSAVDIEQIKDGKYADILYRQAHADEINDMVEAWTRTKTVNELDEQMNRIGVPCGVINTVDRVINDPHVKARNTIVDIEVPGKGVVKFGGHPIKMSASPVEIYASPHELGQDNENVYGDLLGYTTEEIAHLKEIGAI